MLTLKTRAQRPLTKRTTVAAITASNPRGLALWLEKCRLPREEPRQTVQHKGAAVCSDTGKLDPTEAKLLAACANSIRGDSVLRFNRKL